MIFILKKYVVRKKDIEERQDCNININVMCPTRHLQTKGNICSCGIKVLLEELT